MLNDKLLRQSLYRTNPDPIPPKSPEEMKAAQEKERGILAKYAIVHDEAAANAYSDFKVQPDISDIANLVHEVRALDKTGEGSIERHEFYMLDGIRALNPMIQKGLFMAYNADGGEDLSLQELSYGMLTTCQGNALDKLKLAFEMADRNGNKALSKDELKDMVLSFRVALGREMGLVDANHLALPVLEETINEDIDLFLVHCKKNGPDEEGAMSEGVRREVFCMTLLSMGPEMDALRKRLCMDEVLGPIHVQSCAPQLGALAESPVPKTQRMWLADPRCEKIFVTLIGINMAIEMECTSNANRKIPLPTSGDYAIQEFNPQDFKRIREAKGFRDRIFKQAMSIKAVIAQLAYADNQTEMLMEPDADGYFIYVTYDQRYLIETITPSDCATLCTYTGKLGKYLETQPNSLLNPPLGMFQNMDGDRVVGLPFVVRRNPFPGHLQVSTPLDREVHICRAERWELKGATFGRSRLDPRTSRLDPRLALTDATRPDYQSVVCMDSDIVRTGRVLKMYQDVCDEIVDQTRRDTAFLAKQNIYGYNFNISVFKHVAGLDKPSENWAYRSFDDAETYHFTITNMFKKYDNFAVAKSFALQTYAFLWNSYSNDNSSVSCQHPETYASRLVNFVKHQVFLAVPDCFAP